MNEEIQNISKEAGILHSLLEKEMFDLKQIRQFLARVERLNNPHGAKKKRNRFERQLSKLK